MIVAFMGTPTFTVPVLEALLQGGYQVVGVYTQPDKPAGRGRAMVASPVKQFALARGLHLLQPPSLRKQEVQQGLAALAPEAIVVAAYGKFLPSEVLRLPPLGCLNLHPSLLPKYRGASPVASAILEGNDRTGISIILLDEGMDAGPILAQEETEIGPNESAGALTERLFRMGAGLLLETLPLWARGEIRPRPQDDSLASVTRQLTKEDGKIDWGLPAVALWRRVRAYDPWPGVYTSWRGRLLKILEAIPIEYQQPVGLGTVVLTPQGGIGVATGQGTLELRRLQLEGRRAVDISEFSQGHRDFVGERLGG